MTDERLKGRIALIIGGSSGLGKATAIKFASSGARIAIADLHSGGVEDQIKQQHGDAAAIFTLCNVTQETDIIKVIEEVTQWGGRLDILCNFAGIFVDRADGNPARCHELAAEQFDQTIAVNCRGTWLCCKYALKQMMEQEPLAPNARGERTRGWIVNTASTAGLVGMPGMPSYATSKHAIVGMTKQMAVEYAQDRIHVNCLAPGCVESPMTANLLATKEGRAQMAGLHPWNAVGHPEDIANAALFLASDEAAFITGHVLAIDGGLMAAGSKRVIEAD